MYTVHCIYMYVYIYVLPQLNCNLQLLTVCACFYFFSETLEKPYKLELCIMARVADPDQLSAAIRIRKLKI